MCDSGALRYASSMRPSVHSLHWKENSGTMVADAGLSGSCDGSYAGTSSHDTSTKSGPSCDKGKGGTDGEVNEWSGLAVPESQGAEEAG
jgi:hypothetical protein